VELTWLDIPTQHGILSDECTRNPGEPPSGCDGLLDRVTGDGERIEWDAPWMWDDAIPGEAEPGKQVPLALFRCRKCRTTLVVTKCRNAEGKEYLRSRNEWSKPEPSGRPMAVTA
jgi:hypothetical protein